MRAAGEMDMWTETNWFAVHVKAGQEGVARLPIESLQLEVFLPRVQEARVVRGNRHAVAKELFHGYLFARFCPAVYLHLVRYTRGVLRVVSNGESPVVVEPEIIAAIRERMDEDGFVALDEQPHWRAGERL